MVHWVKTFIAIVMGFILAACSSPTLENAGSGLNAKPAMWVAETPTSRVYFLGSVHALPPQIKWYSPEIRKAFETSHELVFESISTEDIKERGRNYSKQYGLLPGGKVISDYISSSEYLAYQKIVKEASMDSYYADRMRPWLFILTLKSIISESMSRYGVDNLMNAAALKQNKRINALETIEESLHALSSVPLPKDIQNLQKLLNTKEVTQEDIRKRSDMLISWAIGDTERTERLLIQNIPSYDYHNLIIKRNNNWYPKIKQYMSKKQTTLIVVGQAHLLGRGNILSKLKRSGYSVKRVQ